MLAHSLASAVFGEPATDSRCQRLLAYLLQPLRDEYTRGRPNRPFHIRCTVVARAGLRLRRETIGRQEPAWFRQALDHCFCDLSRKPLPQNKRHKAEDAVSFSRLSIGHAA